MPRNLHCDCDETILVALYPDLRTLAWAPGTPIRIQRSMQNRGEMLEMITPIVPRMLPRLRDCGHREKFNLGGGMDDGGT